MPEPQSGALTTSPYSPWQGRQDSNPRHAVLETAVLPAELRPYRRVTRHLVEGEGFEPSKLSQRIYSPPHLATLVPLRSGASDRNRTCDLLITSQLLYLLSYAGAATRYKLTHPKHRCQRRFAHFLLTKFTNYSPLFCSRFKETLRTGVNVEMACL
jgi:hypothetical protein